MHRNEKKIKSSYIYYSPHFLFGEKNAKIGPIYLTGEKKMNVYAQPVWVKNEISTLHLGFL